MGPIAIEKSFAQMFIVRVVTDAKWNNISRQSDFAEHGQNTNKIAQKLSACGSWRQCFGQQKRDQGAL